MSSAPVTTFWRLAGLSYLQYVNRAAYAVRGALKEPARSRAEGRSTFVYKTSVWKAGEQGAKKEVTALKEAGPKA